MSDKLVIFDEVQHKVLKIRIYPNQDQTILINKTFGSCRKLYNEHLQERNEFYIDNILPIPKKERQLKSKEIYKKFKLAPQIYFAYALPFEAFHELQL